MRCNIDGTLDLSFSSWFVVLSQRYENESSDHEHRWSSIEFKELKPSLLSLLLETLNEPAGTTTSLIYEAKENESPGFVDIKSTDNKRILEV
jgi:hypothetical protein